VASYIPVSLFSLRMTHATSKGGKTLVVPTPYSLKMTLLDACFRRFPQEEAGKRAEGVFQLLKWREMRVRPPKQCVVNNTFVKALDWDRDAEKGPFRQTIVYREFAFFEGDELLVALGADGLSEAERSLMGELFAHVNMLGKRGGFWQFNGLEEADGNLPFGFTVPRSDATLEQIATYEMTQALDEFGEALCEAKDGFDRVSTYGEGTIRLGEQRVLVPVAVPYRRRGASRHYTWYERVEPMNGG
jgi:hypothetical protein